MLPIYICEDNVPQLKNFEKNVSKILEEEMLTDQITIECVSCTPEGILSHLRENIRPSLYFLDVNLGEDVINGIELGVQIRKYDPRGYIVIVTTHSECAPMVFKYKIEAMDYIIKDYYEELPGRIRDCILRAYELFTTPEAEKKSEIYALEVLEGKMHRLIMHKSNERLIVKDTLKKKMDELGGGYFKCHKSYAINLTRVKNVDTEKNVAIMDNGVEIPVSRRNVMKLKKMIEIGNSG